MRRRARSGAGSRAPGADERRGPVLAVAAEQLVGALSRERDGHVLRGELRRGRGSRATRGRRRGSSSDQTSSARSTVCVGVARARARGDRCRRARRRSAASASSLSSPASAKPIEKVLTGSRHVPRHQRDDQARVEAAAQHRAERDVAHQAQAHRRRRAARAAPRRPRRARASGPAPGSGYAPVAARRGRRRRRRRAARPGISLRDAGERRQRARDEAEREVGVDRLVVELGVDEAAREHALQLGGEDEQVADLARSRAA